MVSCSPPALSDSAFRNRRCLEAMGSPQRVPSDDSDNTIIRNPMLAGHLLGNRVEILEEHRSRLERLAKDRQQSVNAAGRCFVEVVAAHANPRHLRKTWLKYLDHLEQERDPVDRAAMGPQCKVSDDRVDWKRMRGAT